MQETLKVIGAQESYFTGKLESYLRAKGIPYQNIPFTIERVPKAAAHTGVFQIPQVMAGKAVVSYEALGVGWTEPAKPYRLWCLDQLRQAYKALDDAARARVGEALGTNTETILSAAPTGKLDNQVGPLPIAATGGERPSLDSWWRQA